MKLSLVGQITEVKREIAMRERVYPYHVKQLKMKQGEADYHLAAIKSVLSSLEFLQEHECAIREYIRAKKEDAQ